MEKHCTNCEAFAWWDGDFCCTAKMSIIEQSPDGKFWCPFPQPHQKSFNAEECEGYRYSENDKWYTEEYKRFLETLKANGDENLSIDEYYEKYYDKYSKL